MADKNDWGNGSGFDSVSGVDTVPKKKKGKKIALISVSALVIAGAGCFAAYGLSDFVKNQVNVRVMSPEKYFAWVSEENTSKIASETADKYREGLDEYSKGQKASVALKYDVSDGAKELLIDDMGLDESTEDEKAVLDIIKNTDSIGVGAEEQLNGGKIAGNYYLKYNDEKLMTVDVASGDENVFGRIPELSEQWIGMNLGESLIDYIYGTAYGEDEDSEKIIDAQRKILENPEEFLTPEELEDMINRYFGVWRNSVDEVTVEKSESVDICDISVDYIVMSTEVNSAKFVEIAENLVNELKNDSVIKRIVVEDMGVCTDEEYSESLDEMLEEERDIESDTETVVTVDTYVDPNGDIRGIKFTDNDDSTNEIKAVVGKDGSETRGEFYIMTAGERDYTLTLTSTETGGKQTGDISFSDGSDDFSVEFTDLEVVDENKFYVNGTVVLNIPDTDPISLSLSSDGNSQDVSMDVNIDDVDYGKVTLTYSQDYGAEPEIPSTDGAFMVDTESGFVLEDYVTEEQMSGFLKDVFVKIGLPESDAQEAGEGLASAFYVDYSDYDEGVHFTDDDYDDWDDWDDLEDVTETVKTEAETEQEQEVSETDSENESEEDFSENFGFEELPAPENGVEVAENQAYMYVADNSMMIYYEGGAEDPLAAGAVNPTITGNGTYTAVVTADTDSYRKISDTNPDGIFMLGVDYYGPESISFEIKSVKIDGKEYPVSVPEDSGLDVDGTDQLIYLDMSVDDGESYMTDLSDVGEWKTIEVTFEVTGFAE